MGLKVVTITGADDNVNPEELSKLSEEFPFVEWGILFSRKRHGTPRYPTKEWIRSLEFQKSRFCAHLCGAYARELMSVVGSQENPNWVDEFFDINVNFSRIQLNLGTEGALTAPEKLLWNLSNWVGEGIIFQVGDPPTAAKALQHEKELNRDGAKWQYHILFDPSGGRGQRPTEWPQATWRPFGYSGGLSANNIKEEFPKIRAAASGRSYWVDTESGVRTDDQFDLEKVRVFLNTIHEMLHEFASQHHKK